MKDSPSPPPAPDYAGAARAQGAANVDTAKIQGRISNPNIISPYGNQTVDWGNGTVDQKQYDAVLAAYNAGQPWTFQGQDTTRMPTAADFTTYGDQPTVTQTLNPQSQSIFDAQQQARLGLSNLAQQGIGTAQSTLGTPFQFQGPNVQQSVGNPSVQGAPDLFGFGQADTTGGAGQGINSGPQAGQYGYAQQGVNAPQLQTNLGYNGPGLPQQGGIRNQLDTAGVPGMPVNPGMTAQTALMARLQPQIERERGQLETQLRNQGLVAGGEAYGNSMTIQNQRENDMLMQAALQGVGLDLSANQQGFGQAQAKGQFGNQAQAQGFGQGMQANQQGFNQAVQSGRFGNEAQMASFGAGLQNAQLYNQGQAQNYGQGIAAQQAQNQAQGQAFGQQATQQGMGNQAVAQNQAAALQQQQAGNQAAGQQFNQNMGAGQFGNTAQQQMLQQQLYQRNLPLNEIAALMSGSQIQNPQFQGYQSAQVAPPPIANAAAQQAQYNQGLYNAGVGQQNAMTSGLFSLGSAAMGLPWGTWFPR